MRFGIISDLHLEFANWFFEPIPDVIYLNAGDTHPRGEYRHMFWKNHWRDGNVEGVQATCMGNHDFYAGDCPKPGDNQHIQMLGGYKIAYCTLWTPMKKRDHWDRYSRCLVDKRCMSSDWTMDRYMECHESDWEFIKNSGADIIMTHHAPSFLSVHPRFTIDDGSRALNKFFANNLDDDILALEKPPKLWIHGHVHDDFDYMIGQTRVVCHPRGYPHEDNHLNYAPKIVDIE